MKRAAAVVPFLMVLALLRGSGASDQAPGSGGGGAPRVPAGFRPAPNAGAEPYTGTGWAAVVIHEKTGLTMVFVPAGENLMGSSDAEMRRAGFDPSPNEAGRHLVRLTRPFFMGKIEVTNADFRKYKPDHASGKTIMGGDLNGDAQPVVRISWDEAQAFAEWTGLSLPTEAEWEYACRAGTASLYPYGEEPSGLGRYAWFSGNSGRRRRQTHPGGQKLPNPWGLYDMLGNVWEWCDGWYGERFYADFAAEHPNVPQIDPQGPASGTRRVRRGGCWADFPVNCRPAARFSGEPDDRSETCGLRLVYRLKPDGAQADGAKGGGR